MSEHQVCETNDSTERKVTYYQRKNEIQSLQVQIKVLQAQLAKSKQDAFRNSLTNDVLTTSIEQTSTVIAGVQSMMTAHNLQRAQASDTTPLHRYLHLPADPTERQTIMESLFTSNIPVAMQFMTERTKFLDLRVTHRRSEQFDLPNGDMTAEAMDIAQFDGGHSLRQVYDAFMYFQTHQEMSFSEKLGFLTIRESDEPDDATISQTRLRTAITSGVEIESNGVLTCYYASATVDSPAYAIGVMDFVDYDELYPYRPDKCVRKNVLYIVTLYELPAVDGSNPLIVMARWSHVRLLHPSFPLDNDTKATIRHGLLEWCKIIPNVVRERLSTIPPQ